MNKPAYTAFTLRENLWIHGPTSKGTKSSIPFPGQKPSATRLWPGRQHQEGHSVEPLGRVERHLFSHRPHDNTARERERTSARRKLQHQHREFVYSSLILFIDQRGPVQTYLVDPSKHPVVSEWFHCDKYAREEQTWKDFLFRLGKDKPDLSSRVEVHVDGASFWATASTFGIFVRLKVISPPIHDSCAVWDEPRLPRQSTWVIPE
ncbi:hypothetical protein B0H63DRAFT_197815 [Podospora didyma]|uniref:Uncharacterized protein n=1 Tax=Podospora didyma TaxID=330526 RepID=A0AAE0NGY4_9PEZI|nr:hypothetical protein B0H63DRAFT_197815 [Podospora didyma]